MKRGNFQFYLLAVALILSLASGMFSQSSSIRPRTTLNTFNTRSVVDGQELKITGIVVKRDADSFVVREPNGTETVVGLTDSTEVKTVRKGLFRADRVSGVGYILRGLRVKIEGRGNAEGQLVAKRIRFTEDDLNTAQALEARVDPVENMAAQTKVLAEANQQRIDEAEENARKMSGQIDELTAVAAAAADGAKRAQVTADQAQATGNRAEAAANLANQRINGLDDYDVMNTVTVHFRPGSAVLSAAAKDQIELVARAVQLENLKGWIVEVVGYADSTGKSSRNRSLSERRAQAVINYLVTKYNLPLRRLVQPFGYGSENPVASNDTGEGRSLNRRVEIKVLVNKSFSTQAGL
ncbi:MAG TPA: OmpA family protein [Pyrinomonadaceae bacterium]|nr:OmpA family protein [Pyrinomonadaceae bacterium]